MTIHLCVCRFHPPFVDYINITSLISPFLDGKTPSIFDTLCWLNNPCLGSQYEPVLATSTCWLNPQKTQMLGQPWLVLVLRFPHCLVNIIGTSYDIISSSNPKNMKHNKTIRNGNLWNPQTNSLFPPYIASLKPAVSILLGFPSPSMRLCPGIHTRRT